MFTHLALAQVRWTRIRWCLDERGLSTRNGLRGSTATCKLIPSLSSWGEGVHGQRRPSSGVRWCQAVESPRWRPTRRFPGCVPGGLCRLTGRARFQPDHHGERGGVLDRFLVACGRPAWSHPRRRRPCRGRLDHSGLAASTRRGYVQAFKGFHRFLVARKAAEIEGLFGFAWSTRWTSSTQPAMSARTHHQLTPRQARSGWRSSSSS